MSEVTAGSAAPLRSLDLENTLLYTPNSSLSTIACLAVLWSLYWLRKKLHGHIFFIQLVLLTAVDFVQSITDALTAYNGIGHFVEFSLGACQASTTLRVYCEFLTCLLEVHIAAGFVFACFGNARHTRLLAKLLPACFMLAAMLLFFVRPWSSVYRGPSKDCPNFQICKLNVMPGWGVVAFGCCAIAATLYICGAVRLSHAPHGIRRRAWSRGLSYSLCFLFSFGPRAVNDFVYELDGHKAIFWMNSCLATSMLCLNGFLNACAFYFWMWRKRVLRSECSFHRHCADVDSLMIDTYFDLYLSDADDSHAFGARRRLATAVAEAVEAREL